MSIESNKEEKVRMSIFPLVGVVLFPGMSLPLHIFEERYTEMIIKCLDQDKQFGIVLAYGNMCAEVGTVAKIIDVEKLEGGQINLLTEGKERFKILEFVSEKPFYEALVQTYNDRDKELKPNESLKRSLTEVKTLSSKALTIFNSIFSQGSSKKLRLPKEPNELLFLVSANLTCSYEAKQSILEARSLAERIEKVLPLLREEIVKLEVLLENKKTKKDVIKNGKLKI